MVYVRNNAHALRKKILNVTEDKSEMRQMIIMNQLIDQTFIEVQYQSLRVEKEADKKFNDRLERGKSGRIGRCVLPSKALGNQTEVTGKELRTAFYIDTFGQELVEQLIIGWT